MKTHTQLNILIVTQYFWPENMRINDLVQGFLTKGHKVTVLTGVPNYPDGKVFANYTANKQEFLNYQGASIVRVPMWTRGNSNFKLSLNYLSFFISGSIWGLYKLRGKTYDAVFVYGVSPILAAIPAVIIGRIKAAPVMLWVLDLWPETLSAVGAVKNKFILKAMGKVVSWIYNRSDYILFQSRAFKASILKYCTQSISEDRLVYFPNWSEDVIADNPAVEAHFLLPRDERYFTVMFAGNVAESQDFPSIIAAFARLKPHAFIRLVIIGEGVMHNYVSLEVKNQQLDNVLLLGRHPITEMPQFFAAADAFLVSLKKEDIFSKTIPGKLQAYLASGTPVIGMIDGEAAAIIRESGAGLVCPAGDPQGLAEAIYQLSQLSVAERKHMGLRGRAYYEQYFQSGPLFDQLEQLFQTATSRVLDA